MNEIGPLLGLAGPTAIGKTGLSLELARRYDCEIISVDSVQVYRYLDIGTAKVSLEARKEIPHHLIDIVDPDESYHAARFVRDASEAIRDIRGRGKIPLLVGGTGLYFKALQDGLFSGGDSDRHIRDQLQSRLEKEGSQALHAELMTHDPVSAARIHSNDSARIIRAMEVFLTTGLPLSHHFEKQGKQGAEHPIHVTMLLVCLDCPRPLLYERINTRTIMMIEQGLENEVRDLLSRGFTPDLKSMQTIGYRHMINYIDGTWSHDRMIELLTRDTRRYAKRQLTWFRNRPGTEWFNAADYSMIVRTIDSWLNDFQRLR